MSRIENDVFAMLTTMGSCHRMLQDFGRELRERSGIARVTHCADLYNLDDEAFRLLEYVDAELLNEDAFSWRLEVTLCRDTFIVEADVRRVQRDGYDLRGELESEFRDVLGCTAYMLEAVQWLRQTDPMKQGMRND